MDFTLSSEQHELASLAERIFRERATVARLVEVESAAERVDRALWRELAAAGLLGVALPGDVGGLDLGLVGLALVAEAQGRTLAPVPYVWTALAALALSAYGDVEQRDLLAAVVGGEAMLTLAPPRSCAGLGVVDGRLHGRAVGVPWAPVAGCVLLPVGERLYALDPARPGVRLSPGEATSREPYAELRLDGVPAAPVGPGGTAGWLWARARVALAALQAGVTAAALRMTADYTSARRQFGKPLSSFQGVALKAADAYVDTAAIRATALQAAWRADRGDELSAYALTAAWWAAEAGQHCVHVTQHLHGGIGADVTYPVHRYFLWGKQIEGLLGGAPACLAELGDALAGLDAPGDAVAPPT